MSTFHCNFMIIKQIITVQQIKQKKKDKVWRSDWTYFYQIGWGAQWSQHHQGRQLHVRGSASLYPEKVKGNHYYCLNETQITRPKGPSRGEGTTSGAIVQEIPPNLSWDIMWWSVWFDDGQAPASQCSVWDYQISPKHLHKSDKKSTFTLGSFHTTHVEISCCELLFFL